MYKLVHLDQDDSPHLRIRECVIERVDGDKVSFFCNYDSNLHTIMGNVVIHTEEFIPYILHTIDGKIKKIKMSEWIDGRSSIFDNLTARFSHRVDDPSRPLFTFKGGSYYKTRDIELYNEYCITKIDAGSLFSIDEDSGTVMVITYMRNSIKHLVIYKVDALSTRVVFSENIKTSSQLELNAKEMKIIVYDSEECWKIDYQPGTLLSICRKKVDTFMTQYKSLPKEALED